MDKKILEKLVNEGKSTWQIATECNRSQTNIRRWLKKYGLVTKNKSRFGHRIETINGKHVKRCGRCFNLLEYPDEFASSGKQTRTICKQCGRDKFKESIAQAQKYVREIKTKCSICGYDRNPSAMDFHHIVDGKETRISVMRNILQIKEEVKKCILVCANCHREIHNEDYNRY